MKLTKIIINNYRCLSNCTINLGDYISLIGPNNTGKSSILRAINLFLGQTKPEPDEWRKDHEDEDITIEGCFAEITERERRISGIAGLVYNNEIKLKLRIFKDNGSIKTEYTAFNREEIINGWADSWINITDEIKSLATSIGITTGTDFRSQANKEKLKQHIRDNKPDLISYGEERWSSDSISFANALKQGLPQSVLIEAVKDASETAKPLAKNTFGMLLNNIVLPSLLETEEFRDLENSIRTLDNKIRGNGVDKLECIQNLEDALHETMASIIESKATVALDSPDTDKLITNNTRWSPEFSATNPLYPVRLQKVFSNSRLPLGDNPGHA